VSICAREVKCEVSTDGVGGIVRDIRVDSDIGFCLAVIGRENVSGYCPNNQNSVVPISR
jgi:hypothetical protein